METKNDFFKLDTTTTLKESFKLLFDIIKEHSKEINVYELDNYLYFSIENINLFGDYFKKISNFAYYHDCINLEESEFKTLVSSYDLRNDLLELD